MTTQKETQLERARGIQSELLGLLEGMDYCLDWKPDSTAWSVREIVYHLLDTPAGDVHTVLRGILSGEITEFEVWADRTNITPERQSNDFEAVVEEITVLFRGIQAALESAGEQDLTGKSALARLRSYDRDDQRTPVGLLDGVFARHWGEHMGQIRELREALGV